MKTYNILSTFRIIKNSAFLQMKSNAVSIYFIATAFIQPVIFTSFLLELMCTERSRTLVCLPLLGQV